MLGRFQTVLQPWLSRDVPIVVAVSGGADSLALTLLADTTLRAMGRDPCLLHAVTVDHQLRPESTEEAEKVHSWLTARGIQHTTLIWEHEPVTSGMEAKARAARYRLLTDYCRRNQVPLLMTAHHALDHLETFFMHLARGSSLEGICGIRPLTFRQGVAIVRPFLSVFPEDLQKVLTEYYRQEFVSDPSNESLLLERVRWRHLLTESALLKAALPHMVRSLESLNTLSGFIDEAADFFIQQHCEFVEGEALFPKQQWTSLFPPVGDRVIKKLVQQVAMTERPLSSHLLERLCEKIRQPNFKGATAHHCVVRAARGGHLKIQREQRPRLETDRLGKDNF